MGHINLAIQQDQHKGWYILSDASYMGEAWLARVDENDSTKIIRQFRCKNFKDCFRDLKVFIDTLGEVKKMSAVGVKESDAALLEDILLGSSDGILPVNDPKANETGLFWDWLQNDRYMTL
jgi:hypothetical protein